MKTNQFLTLLSSLCVLSVVTERRLPDTASSRLVEVSQISLCSQGDNDCGGTSLMLSHSTLSIIGV